MWNRRLFLEAGAMAALLPTIARADDQLIRLVVPFSAGSGTDVSGRVLADAMNKVSGRNVIIENKPGSGSVIASLEVVHAKPDGNTLLYTTGAHTTNAALFKNLSFDPIADFTPITRLARSSGFALLVSKDSPFKTLDQFVAAAKARPGALTFGSSGVGNTTHVMGVLFCRGVGIDLLHIPFKGTPTTELMSGTVDSAFLSPTIAGQQIRAGQLRALGISGTVRSRLLPDVPTFTELGLKIQDIPAWSGIFGPARMPPDVVAATYETIAKAAKSPLLINFMHENGDEPEAFPPGPFKAYVTSEIERYRKVLPPLGIQIG